MNALTMQTTLMQDIMEMQDRKSLKKEKQLFITNNERKKVLKRIQILDIKFSPNKKDKLEKIVNHFQPQKETKNQTWKKKNKNKVF